jgi:hypothetical protein
MSLSGRRNLPSLGLSATPLSSGGPQTVAKTEQLAIDSSASLITKESIAEAKTGEKSSVSSPLSLGNKITNTIGRTQEKTPESSLSPATLKTEKESGASVSPALQSVAKVQEKSSETTTSPLITGSPLEMQATVGSPLDVKTSILLDSTELKTIMEGRQRKHEVLLKMKVFLILYAYQYIYIHTNMNISLFHSDNIYISMILMTLTSTIFVL